MQRFNPLVKDSFWIAIAQGVGAVSTLLIASALTRFLNLQDYGQYQLILSYVALASVFALPGLMQAGIQGAAQGYDLILPKIVRKSLKGAFLAQVLFLGTGALWIILGKDEKLGSLFVIASFSFYAVSLGFFDNFLSGKRMFGLSRRLFAVNQMLRLSAIVVTGYFTRSVKAVLAVDILLQLLYTAAGYYLAHRMISPRVEDMSTENKLMHLGWRMTLLGAAGIVASRAEKIILGILSPEALALYTIGEMIPRKIRDHAKQFLIVPVTRWAGLEEKENHARVRRFAWVFIGIGVLFFALIFFLSPIFIPLLFSRAYVEAVRITQILSAVLIFTFFQTMILNLALFQGYEKVFQKIQFATMFLKLGLLALLTPRYQVYGVVTAVLLTEMAGFIIVLFWFLRKPVLSSPVPRD